MAYQRTVWLDHIVAKDTGEVLQVGTPLDAIRLNNLEEGVLSACTSVEALQEGMESTVSEETFTYELSKKVDIAEGMDLSTNDFTDELKDKLDELPTAAELEVSLADLSAATDAKIDEAMETLQGILHIEGDSASFDLLAMSTAITNLQSALSTLQDKITALETWKTNVLAGSTVVITKTS